MQRKVVFKKILSWFIQGLIFTAPVVITVYIIAMLFNFVDGLLTNVISGLIGVRIPGLGLVVVLGIITLIGFFGSSILFRPLLAYLDKLISQAPLVKIIYTSIKDFLSAFVGKEKRFTEPVLVKVGKGADLEKMGFITQHDLSNLGITSGKVAVYLPHSYNFSGNLFIVPIENITPLHVSPAEVMKFIVTAGVTNIDKSLIDEIVDESIDLKPGDED
ncbi:MAG: DUF502 domain-containing protein [Lentimicrobium sp.]|jgi:uncharacterized membrane protein|nr:DUF502 domain-containing protein [Lentimicrobium sp.]